MAHTENIQKKGLTCGTETNDNNNVLFIRTGIQLVTEHQIKIKATAVFFLFSQETTYCINVLKDLNLSLEIPMKNEKDYRETDGKSKREVLNKKQGLYAEVEFSAHG